MQASIEDSFKKAGYLLSDINFKDDKNWCKDTFQLASNLGLLDQYEFSFRTSSGAVHANWHFLEIYNLSEENGVYLPNINYASAIPQIIEGGSYLVLSAEFDYLENFPNNP